jgi:glycosyltransferase 2 family protein
LKFLKPILKYVLTIGLAFWLLIYVYRDQDIPRMLDRLKDVDFQWIIYSFILAIFGNLLRSYRWNLLLKPMDYNLKTFRTFLSVMVGYFTNLIIPRAGEISRCAVLKKTDKVNMTHSIGTVVAERAIDLLMLIMMVAMAFAIEFDLLYQYLGGIFDVNIFKGNGLLVLMVSILVVILSLVAFFVVKKYKNEIKNSSLYLKIKGLVSELAEGFTSIKKMDNLTGFLVSSILIWVLYFLMSYVAFFSIPETSHLGFRAGMSILAMSSLSMLVPVQAGIGAYHFLVSGVLLHYGIAEQDGVFFAGLLHGSQVLLVIVVGGVSFIISALIKRRDSRTRTTSIVS